ncbi:MAG TPA: bifunctional phosphoribosyl-AMP cyclohydrolase/phosphoribosyl-ATP diphosphatase HisIE [Steroidobacteraceae bacterium]|jgi:phosphoribosyl-ATP pyrophosphohydrolase/phosphoribosyl-AMP cyclohydrolase|nr:bifunctional phosphoribosyl-AMP cyclohydrolase/phosphoribosyl-ATP diphosphatase HisIE [Steroidobacteraceae bacterium]
MSLTPSELARIDWDKGGGLVPAIVQDARNGAVLMLGYMNREALQTTLETRHVNFYSRSRQRLWRKGETSGNELELRTIRLDCDGDTLLLGAIPSGPVCHTGTATCFGNASISDPAPAEARLAFIGELERIIAQRIAAPAEGSYTARLYQGGIKRMAQKVGEEALEVALAACTEGDAALLGECGDLIYHLLVLLRARGLSLEQVAELLRERHLAASGTR